MKGLRMEFDKNKQKEALENLYELDETTNNSTKKRIKHDRTQ